LAPNTDDLKKRTFEILVVSKVLFVLFDVSDELPEIILRQGVDVFFGNTANRTFERKEFVDAARWIDVIDLFPSSGCAELLKFYKGRDADLKQLFMD